MSLQYLSEHNKNFRNTCRVVCMYITFPAFFKIRITTWHFTHMISFNSHNKPKSWVLLSQLHNKKPIYYKRKGKFSSVVETDPSLLAFTCFSTHHAAFLEVASNFHDFHDPFTLRVSASRSQSSTSIALVSKRWDYLAKL